MLTDTFYKRAIITVSVAIPVVVALMFILPHTIHVDADLRFMPRFHATLNFLTTILLLCGFYAITKKNVAVHKAFMFGAFTLSSIFLVSYVIYHTLAPTTKYGGDGALRYIYYFILLTHIMLSGIILPFILFTFYRSLTGDFAKHRKIARITLPLWLYVTVTGVLVYLLISPYY